MKKFIHALSRQSAVTAAAAVLFFGSAGLAAAQSTADLNAQIQALLAQIAALQGQLGSTSAGSAFTRDLTLGSQGADVSQLQSFLISKGYSIPAGATGYFGTQTQAAVATFQAANGITPAAGYFGPVTRARVNAMVVTTPASGGAGQSSGGDTAVLKGGEATLRSFDLRAGNDLSAGDSNQEIAEAKFNVTGGDVRLGRMTIEFTANDTALSVQPWQYVKRLSVYDGSKKVGSVVTDSRNDWDKNGTTYSIDISLDDVVRSGDTANLSVRADAQNTIDSQNTDQSFSLAIPDRGIRAVDAKGIQQYIGKDNDVVKLAMNGAQNGDLTVRLDSSNPDASVLVAETNRTSDTFKVLAFDLRNQDDASVLLDQITVRVDATFANGSVSGEDVNNIIHRATLTLGGKTYQGTVSGSDSGSYEGSILFKRMDATIGGNKTAEGTLTLDLYGSNGHYDSGAVLAFDLPAADVMAEGEKNGEASDVRGSAHGNTMTVVTGAGLQTTGRGATSTLTTNGDDQSLAYGTFTLKFDVTALGGDVYVPKSVTLDAASSTYAGVHLVNMDDGFSGTSSASLTSTARSYNDYFYVISEGDTKSFTAQVVLNPDAAGFYQVGLDSIQFSATGNDLNSLQSLDVDQSKGLFHTDPLYIPD